MQRDISHELASERSNRAAAFYQNLDAGPEDRCGNSHIYAAHAAVGLQGRLGPAIQCRSFLSCRGQSECLPRLHWSRRCAPRRVLPSLQLLKIRSIKWALTHRTSCISRNNAGSGADHLRRRPPLGKDGGKPKAKDMPSAMALCPVTIKGREATASTYFIRARRRTAWCHPSTRRRWPSRRLQDWLALRAIDGIAREQESEKRDPHLLFHDRKRNEVLTLEAQQYVRR